MKSPPFSLFFSFCPRSTYSSPPPPPPPPLLPSSLARTLSPPLFSRTPYLPPPFPPILHHPSNPTASPLDPSPTHAHACAPTRPRCPRPFPGPVGGLCRCSPKRTPISLTTRSSVKSTATSTSFWCCFWCLFGPFLTHFQAPLAVYEACPT